MQHGHVQAQPRIAKCGNITIIDIYIYVFFHNCTTALVCCVTITSINIRMNIFCMRIYPLLSLLSPSLALSLALSFSLLPRPRPRPRPLPL